MTREFIESVSGYTWFYPKNREDLQLFPNDATATTLRPLPDCTDDDLYLLPESLQRVYIACCDKLVHLQGLHRLSNLTHLDIEVCRGITQNAINDLRQALPNTKVCTWGCWQLAQTDPEVQKQSDDLFINVLGVLPPRLLDSLIV
jgi:hypothetical protein